MLCRNRMQGIVLIKRLTLSDQFKYVSAAVSLGFLHAQTHLMRYCIVIHQSNSTSLHMSLGRMKQMIRNKLMKNAEMRSTGTADGCQNAFLKSSGIKEPLVKRGS